jgi:prepilin peptidase CpaA
MWPSLLCFAPLAALLGLAAAIDWRSRRIPNWLTLALAACGIAQSFAPWGTVHPTSAMTGFLAGMGLTIIPFAIGALGGGDVKLLAALGIWIGPLPVLWVFLAAAIIGMFIVLAQCAVARQLPALFRNSALIAVNLIHVRELGVEHVSRTGKAAKSVGRPLPYAVPVLLAAVGLILYQKGVWR